MSTLAFIKAAKVVVTILICVCVALITKNAINHTTEFAALSRDIIQKKIDGSDKNDSYFNKDRLIVVFQNPDAETRDIVKRTFGANSLIDQLGLASRTPAPETLEQDVNKAIEINEHPELVDLDIAIQKELQEDVPLPINLTKILIRDGERCNKLGIEECIWIMQKSLKPDTKASKEWAMADLTNKTKEEKIALFNHLAGLINAAQ